MKVLDLVTPGFAALVDDSDYELLKDFRWYALQGPNTTYATRAEGRKTVYLHREIMKPEAGKRIDHIDHNGLNCQRENLRIVTATQNQHNKTRNRRARSTYKGLKWDKSAWAAKITVNGKNRWLGRFPSEIEAAKAYDVAAKLHFGSLALTNF